QIARRWILPASVFLAGAGLALTGIAPGYLAVPGLVLVMGLGVAAWHPEGYKAATGMAAERKPTALSWCSRGGNVGMALGPPAIPFGLVFLETTGVLAFVMLGLYGAVLTSSFSVSIVLGQAYLPRNAGMASGLIVGFAIGAGGLGVTALGWVADRWGLPAALT